MNFQHTKNLYGLDINDFLKVVIKEFPQIWYDRKKHIFIIENETNEVLGNIRLPLHLEVASNLKVTENLNTILYISIESGNAAICIMDGLENVYHTTFSAYMIRKKQGFSQIKYLNKKGKSRAGSRVRLAGTINFFEKINDSLTELFEEFEIDRVALACSKTLIPFLYQSKVACPFSKDDSRLYKIPVHIPQSNYANLDAAIKKLRAPILSYEDQHVEYLQNLLNKFD